MVTDSLAHQVLSLAGRLGAPREEVEVLWDRANLVLRLGTDLIARVATLTARLRGARAREAMHRSVVVASHLESRGVLAPRPATDIDPGPHDCADVYVTFWEHVDHDASREVDPTLAATRLRALHDALASCPLDGFERMMPLTELPPMIDTLARDEIVPADHTALLATRLDAAMREIDALALPETMLHGDSSPGNLLHTPDGAIWSDFEEACIGPRELDLACIVGTGRAFDLPSRPLREAILAAYGPVDEDVLRPFVDARIIQALVWDAAISGDTTTDARRAQWIASLDVG